MTTPPKDNDVIMLLCEDVRQELGGKLTLMGFFGGYKILVPDDTEIASISGLSLVFMIGGGSGSFSPKIDIIEPDGEPAPTPELQPIEVSPTTSAVLVIRFVPFVTHKFGIFRVTLTLSKTIYRRSFEIMKDKSVKAAADWPASPR